MNDDQKQNLERKISALVNSLYRVERYFATLTGLHTAIQKYPEMVENFPELYDELWRALYDALFAAVGTMIERRTDTHSLYGLLTQGIRYVGPGDTANKLNEYRHALQTASDPTIEKLQAWRNEVVAHRTDRSIDPEFYNRNKMTLAEVGAGIDYLKKIVENVSVELLNMVHLWHWNMADLQTECMQVVEAATGK